MGLQIFCWLQEISLSSWYKTQNRNNFRPILTWDTNETNCAILYRKHHTQTLHTVASLKVLQFNYSNYTYQIKLLKLSWTTLNCISSPTEIKLGTIYTHFTFVYSLLHGFIWLIWLSYILNRIFITSRVYLEPPSWPAPSWLVSSVGRAVHR